MVIYGKGKTLNKAKSVSFGWNLPHNHRIGRSRRPRCVLGTDFSRRRICVRGFGDKLCGKIADEGLDGIEESILARTGDMCQQTKRTLISNEYHDNNKYLLNITSIL